MAITIDTIENALMFTGDSTIDSQVYVSLKTGKTYYISDYVDDDEEETPEDLYESDEYIQLPTKQELDLSKNLALDFSNNHMPDYFNKVRQIFSSRGAYGRFKDLLEYHDKLDAWYDYETQATRKAIIDWCNIEGLELEDLKTEKKKKE